MRYSLKTLLSICLFIMMCNVLLARGPKTLLFGPTGISGTISKNTIKVTVVDKGSPADGKIKKGDLITGINGKKFGKQLRHDFVAAIDIAESEVSGGKLNLSVKGKKEVELKLTVLGSYSKTAPYDCAKSEKIIEQLAATLLKPKKGGSGVTHCGILGLMATGEKKHYEAAVKMIKSGKITNIDPKKIDELLDGGQDMGYVGWYWGYNLITLGEYYLLSNDESVLPAMKTYALGLARGQDAGGLWGHRMATKGRGGRLPGYAQMNQPSLTSFMGMLFAWKCGIKDPVLEKGIEKTYAYFSSHVGKGAFPYGVHGPQTRYFNNNGTSGSAAICMALKGDKEGTKFFSQISAPSFNGLENGHASTFFNPMWTPLGANLSGPEVTQQFFRKSLWFIDGRRKWDGDYGNWMKEGPEAGVALLTYCIPRKALFITGREADVSLHLKGKDAKDVIMMDIVDYKAKKSEELMKLAQDHPIPHVRRRAVGVLTERRQELTPKWVEFLKKGSDEQKKMAISQYGWWIKMEDKEAQMDDIGAVLRDSNVNSATRAAAADSLSHFGDKAYPYYMDMVKLVLEDRSDDAFDLTTQAVGGSITKLCKEPFTKGLVKGKDTFYKAAIKLMKHKRSSARAAGVNMLADMPLEDFHIIADEMMHIVENKDATYHSYHSVQGSIGGAISVFAHLNIKEGIPLLVKELDTPGKWGFKVRMICATLPKYGGNAKEALNKLKADKRFATIEKGRFKGIWNNMVKAIEGDKNPRKLMSVVDAKKAGMK